MIRYRVNFKTHKEREIAYRYVSTHLSNIEVFASMSECLIFTVPKPIPIAVRERLRAIGHVGLNEDELC